MSRSIRSALTLATRATIEALEQRRLLASSAWAFPGDDGHLLYQPTPLGDHIEDFSNVGYKAGLIPIPDVPVKATVASPSGGDDTAIIQSAINSVQAMPMSGDGFRGAVLLGPGTFRIDGSLNITASGVVLRGSGENQTILHATTITDTSERTIININGSGTRSVRAGSTHTITDKYVPVGAISFSVNSTANLHVGDTIIVHRPSTQQWINDLGMNLLTNPWTPGSRDINLDRTITHIDGNVITIDAPITQALDLKYTDASEGPNTIYAYTATARLSNVGVENLGGYSDYDAAVKDGNGNAIDENHPWIFINIDGSQNAWARDISAQYFGYAAVFVTGNSKWVTIENSQMIDYVSQITGGRRYGFNIDDSSNCIFRNCYTRQGRHDYVEGSLVPGPNVFVDDRADSTHADAGPHHRYSTAALWDNLQVGQLNIQNRGNSGTGHGWAGANQVIWNSTAGSFIVQNPPAAQNWLIGSVGTIANGTAYVGPHDPGIYDSSGPSGPHVLPRSLYYQQFGERTAYAGFAQREVRLGDSDSFTPGDAADTPPLDSTWRSNIQSATGQTAVGLDVANNGQLVPMTYNLNLDPGTQVVGASLSLGLKSAGNSTSGDKIYLDGTGPSFSWSDLGVAAPGLTPGGEVIDLSPFLSLLQDGQFNFAVSGNSAIDWATLNFQTASVTQPATVTVPAAADSYVRDGTSANSNFGSTTALQTKLDTTNNHQESYLKFDLSSLGGSITKAVVRLVPTTVGVAATTFGSGTGAIFNQISQVTDDSWTESGITWNNRPLSGPTLAEFISAPNAPLNFDVTSLVQSAMAGDNLLSFKLNSSVQSGSGQISYASRENADPSLRPELILTIGGNSVSLSGTGGNDTVSLSPGTVNLNGLAIGYAHAGALNLQLGGGSDLLTAAGNSSVTAAAMTLSATGGGIVTLPNGAALPDFTHINIDGAVLRLAAGGGNVLVTPSLSITGGGSLDLNNNRLILSTANQVGTWNGSAYSAISGLNQSGAVTSSSRDQTTRLGIATAAQVLSIPDSATAIWGGQTVTGSDTLVRLTYAGDANLDGKVNIDDYGRIDGNVSQSGIVFGWYNGDFNFDGKINIDDYGIIDGVIGVQGPPLGA